MGGVGQGWPPISLVELMRLATSGPSKRVSSTAKVISKVNSWFTEVGWVGKVGEDEGSNTLGISSTRHSLPSSVHPRHSSSSIVNLLHQGPNIG